jgi:hypothetical protein
MIKGGGRRPPWKKEVRVQSALAGPLIQWCSFFYTSAAPPLGASAPLYSELGSPRWAPLTVQ